MINIDDLVKVKKQKLKSQEDCKKIEVIESLISDKGWCFKTDANTVIGILEFLEVPKEKIVDTYFSMISPQQYSDNMPKERKITEK